MNYVIEKGNHYCKHKPKFHFGATHMRARFSFGAGTWFPKEDKEDWAINKLVGIGYLNHHRNSVRVGWRPATDVGNVDLFFYLYNKGIRTEKYFTTVATRKFYNMNIEMANNLVSFSVRDEDGTTQNDSMYFKLPFIRLGMLLYPYVGGKLPARVSTNIELEAHTFTRFI